MGERYRVRNGLNYPDPSGKRDEKGRLLERRGEPGDIVDDLPAKSTDWLLKDGHIERVEEDPAQETEMAAPQPRSRGRKE